MQMTPAILRTILILILSLNLTPFLALFLIAPNLLSRGHQTLPQAGGRTGALLHEVHS